MAIRISTGLANAMIDALPDRPAAALFSGFHINIYTGSRPTAADDAATGTLLCTITLGGDGTTGLVFDSTTSGGVATKPAGATWSGTNVATGTAGWFRMFIAGDAVTTSSTSLKRIDGTIATSGADINLGFTTLTSGAVTTIPTFTITQPKE